MLYIKKEIIRELKSHKLIINFPNVDLENLKTSVDTKVYKIFQSEYEKEVASNQLPSQVSTLVAKDVYSGLKKRSAKRRSNMQKGDLSSSAWEVEQLPNQKSDDIRNEYTQKMRKYLDKIKSEIVTNSYNGLLTESEIKKIYLFENYKELASQSKKILENNSCINKSKEENKEETKVETRPKEKRGSKTKKDTMATKIYKNNEEINSKLVEFFQLLFCMNGCNLYDFTLRFLEYPLLQSIQAQKLIYTPNSINFLNIFQKVYITIHEWERKMPLESLVFLSEIICKNGDFYYGFN